MAVGVQRLTAPDRLGELLAVVHKAFEGLDPPSSVLNETLNDFAARQRAGVVLAIEDDGRLVASLFAERKGEGLYLTRVAVRPDRRGQGLSRMLIEAAAAEARAAGLAALTLRVRTSLPQNRALFERLGFAVTGEGQENGRVPFLVMERPLVR